MTILTAQELSDLAEILRLHDVALKHYFQNGGMGKSSEGAVEVIFGTFHDRDGWDNPGAPGIVGVSVYSYALGPNRNHYFETIAEGLEAVRGWYATEMGEN
jgi:hypothetical protein